MGSVDEASGSPLTYIYKKRGKVVSGTLSQQTVDITTYSQFEKVYLDELNATEILSVIDSEGNVAVKVKNRHDQ